MMQRGRGLLLLGTLAAVAACTEPEPGTAPGIEAFGRVQGVAFIDLNGSGALDVGDTPLTGLEVEIVQVGGSVPLDTATTDSTGVFVVDSIPTGRYGLNLGESVLGDSLNLLPLTSTDFTLSQADTFTVTVGVGYPTATVEEIRSMEEGRKVSTTGFAMNARIPFGDGAVHLLDRDIAIRVTNVERITIQRGDSVRFLGWTKMQNGQPTLDNVQAFVLTPQATLPLAVNASTKDASTARGGVLDAQLVSVREAPILGAVSSGGDYIVTVDDGSGPVKLRIRSFLSLDVSQLVIGNTLELGTGLLVPDPLVEGEDPTWHLEPRDGADLRIRIPVTP